MTWIAIINNFFSPEKFRYIFLFNRKYIIFILFLFPTATYIDSTQEIFVKLGMILYMETISKMAFLDFWLLTLKRYTSFCSESSWAIYITDSWELDVFIVKVGLPENYCGYSWFLIRIPGSFYTWVGHK